jgi:hypothetical protein
MGVEARRDGLLKTISAGAGSQKLRKTHVGLQKCRNPADFQSRHFPWSVLGS